MLVKTTAQAKIFTLKKRVRIVRGGTSASKTFSIIPFLIEYAVLNPLKEISIVSESIPHLRRGAMRDFKKIMSLTNNWFDNSWNGTNLTYRFANGSFIEFFSADQADKLRGARRDVLFVNECNNVTWEAYHQMAIRTREFIYLDYNPTHEFWVDTEIEGQEDTGIITLTYKDNEALEPSIIKEIEKAKEKAKTSKYWENWWNVYGLGLKGIIEGVIFKDWQIIDTIPEGARYLGTGLDFGFTNDPTTAIDLYKFNDTYILDQILYRKGMHNNEIAGMLKGKIVVADSAEPKSISEIARYNINIVGAKKGADSIMYGVQLLQSHKISITSSSIELIREQRNYCFDKDKNGNSSNRPIDAYNHCMDASRYIATYHLGNKNIGQYHIR